MFAFPSIGLTAAAAAILLLSSAVNVNARPGVARDEKRWVTIWGSMPQLTEPANLPPAPFVSPKMEDSMVSLDVKD
jgi:hypothetical protein